MTKIIAIILFSILSTALFSQEKLKSNDISKFVYSFKINNDTLIGEGAEILKKRIVESQFFLLGEQHFSPEISELTNILLSKLRASNFKYFAAEIGPNSAKKMDSIIKKEKSLFQFNSEFYKKYKDIPIPFFDGKKDEKFLKTAISENFEIWGIDQEFLSAQLFLIDDIYNLSNNKLFIKPYYKKSKKIIEDEFEKNRTTKNYTMFTNILNSDTIKSFFKICTSNEQKAIINDLIIS